MDHIAGVYGKGCFDVSCCDVYLFASVMTWQGNAQQFPTAFRPAAKDLAE